MSQPDEEATAAPDPDGRWCCNGNAEECALCSGTNPPYPFICPGHEDTPENRRQVLVDATDEGKERLRETMRRMRRHDKVTELSAIESWANERDLAEALGSFGDGYRRAQIDAQLALGLDRLSAEEQAERETEVDLDGVDLDAFRNLVSARLLKIALERTEREWICCDPVEVSHALCVQGEATRTMLKALLTDDDTVFPPRSDFLDEAVRLTLGHADPAWRNSVLSTAEIRELYGKAIQHEVVDGLKVDERGQPRGVIELSHAVLVAVMGVRDRELRRNRQRLLLADDLLGRVRQDEALQQTFDVAVEARVRTEERLKVLNEVHVKIMGEIASPIEEIAFRNTLVWLRKARKEAEKGLDKPE